MSKGTYAALRVSALSNRAIRLYCLENGIEVYPPTVEQRMHTTLIHSRVHCPLMAADCDPSAVHMATFKAWKLFKGDLGDDVLVMTLNAPSVMARHKQLMDKHGATFDFPEYQPHITVNYNYHGPEPIQLPRFPFMIVLGEEYVEDLET